MRAEQEIRRLRSKWRFNLPSAAVSALLLSGCAGSADVPLNPANFGAPDRSTVDAALTLPTLRPSDKVRVQVFQEPDLSGDFQVNAAGRIDLPLLGQVDVGGLTAQQASELIRTRLDERFLYNPKVMVSLTNAARDAVTVEGAVQQPGLFPIGQPTTLLRAIALARGTTQQANDRQVIVFRNIEGRRMAAGFDLEAIRRAKADDPLVYPEDVVVVTDSQTRALFRDVLSTVPFFGVFRPF